MTGDFVSKELFSGPAVTLGELGPMEESLGNLLSTKLGPGRWLRNEPSLPRFLEHFLRAQERG